MFHGSNKKMLVAMLFIVARAFPSPIIVSLMSKKDFNPISFGLRVKAKIVECGSLRKASAKRRRNPASTIPCFSVWLKASGRREVYSRDETPMYWRFFSEIHGYQPAQDDAPVLLAASE